VASKLPPLVRGSPLEIPPTLLGLLRGEATDVGLLSLSPEVNISIGFSPTPTDGHGMEKTGVRNAPLDAAKIDGRPIGDAINAGDATEDTSCGVFIFMVRTWEGR